MSNTCGIKCVFPVANLNSEDMQTCDQKCAYYGNYNKPSENNTIVNESPYTMAKMMYSGESDVVFNGVTYSNTSDNNNIEIFLTKPLHTFGKDGKTGVAELIIQHQKNNTGNAPLWVCIPITDTTVQAGGGGARPSATSIIETIIDNLPGVPLIKKQKNSLLVRRVDNSSEGYTQFTFNTPSSQNHKHMDDDKVAVKHQHYHVPGIHISDDTSAKAFIDAYTAGTTQLSNQNELGMSFKLNDVIPISPYYFYNGVFNTSGEISYDNCTSLENININVIVFDIENGIPIREEYANKISSTYEPTSKTTSYPLLMDNNYPAIPDTFKNVSYHPQPFSNSKEDDIYIDCTPVNYKTTEKTTTILQDEKNNEVLDAGASMGSFLLDIVNSSAFAIMIGILAMLLLFKFSRYLIRLIFGKESIPNPGDMMDDLTNTDKIK
jgi:hypothetical protein